MPIQTNGNSISCHITQFQNYFIAKKKFWVTLDMFHVSVRREHLLFASCMLGEVNRSFGHSQKNEKNRNFDRQAYAEETAWADATRGKKKTEEPTPLGCKHQVRGGRAAGWPRYRIIFHTQSME